MPHPFCSFGLPSFLWEHWPCLLCAVALEVLILYNGYHSVQYYLWTLRRCPNCRGNGVGYNWAGVPMECYDCKGSGIKRRPKWTR